MGKNAIGGLMVSALIVCSCGKGKEIGQDVTVKFADEPGAPTRTIKVLKAETAVMASTDTATPAMKDGGWVCTGCKCDANGCYCSECTKVNR